MNNVYHVLTNVLAKLEELENSFTELKTSIQEQCLTESESTEQKII